MVNGVIKVVLDVELGIVPVVIGVVQVVIGVAKATSSLLTY